MPNAAAPVVRNYPSASAPAASAPATEAPVEDGPRASAYPAKDITDLNRVCDESVYYPELPKRAGKAPHPVVLLVDDGVGFGGRIQDNGYHSSLGYSKSLDRTWTPADPKNVQLVACLDRVSAGSKIRNCTFDDPDPVTASLVRAGWRLRVYEAATGRKLLDRKLSGDDHACPFVVLVGPDKKIYASVSDRVVIAALRDLVNR
ncbi:hypothetical protein ACFQX7_07155 [Luedemannella flava]|uniref:hypothetical protein n=1 Tax=Luedemannella flava TaxID=349316 RepID=UPI0031DB372F